MTAMQVNIQTSGSIDSAETIDHSWFGAVQTGFHSFDGFEESAEALNLGLVRWPGGTLAEKRTEVYGMEHEGLFDATDLWATNPNRDRPDLVHSLEYSVENNMDFAMIIPTARYADDIELGEAHLRSFLDDLFTGEYGALPDKFTLELGNEYKALPEFRDNPELYGEISSRFAEVIAEAKDLYLTDEESSGVNVAVQMGINSEHNEAIIGQFSDEALEVTNSLVFHSLPISMRNLNKDNEDENGMNRYEIAESFAEEWRSAITGAGGNSDPDLFMSAWTVGGSTNDPDRISLEWHEFGARSSSVAVDQVAGYSSVGVDSAAIWGVDVNNLNTVTSTESGELELSHTGEIFRMMADSLVGKTYVGEFRPSSRDDLVMTHTFTDGTELTTYVGINERSSENDEVLLDFGGANNIQLVHAEMLSTELDPSFNGNYDDLEARLYENPVTWEMEDVFTEEGLVVDFTQDYDMAEIEVVLGEGLTGSGGADWIRSDVESDAVMGYGGNDYLLGWLGFDSLYGGDGDDVLMGEDGRDRLFGGSGDDTLLGGDQDDFLSSGGGYDRLEGGAGADWFQFNQGTEGGIVRDFSVGVDALDLSEALSPAGSLVINAPGYFDIAEDLGPGGTDARWKMDVLQDGDDTRLQVTDDQGDEQWSILLRDVLVEDLTRDFASNFKLGRDGEVANASAAPLSGQAAAGAGAGLGASEAGAASGKEAETLPGDPPDTAEDASAADTVPPLPVSDPTGAVPDKAASDTFPISDPLGATEKGATAPLPVSDPTGAVPDKAASDAFPISDPGDGGAEESEKTAFPIYDTTDGAKEALATSLPDPTDDSSEEDTANPTDAPDPVGAPSVDMGSGSDETTPLMSRWMSWFNRGNTAETPSDPTVPGANEAEYIFEASDWGMQGGGGQAEAVNSMVPNPNWEDDSADLFADPGVDSDFDHMLAAG